MPLARKSFRSSRARTRNIDRSFEWLGYTLLALYALYLVVIWICARPALHITSVTVLGAHAIASSSVREVAEAKLEQKLLYRINRNNEVLYPKAEMERDVLSLSPRLAHVESHFTDRRNLEITVTEYTPNFLYCMENGIYGLSAASSTEEEHQPMDCYFADDEGYVYAEAPEYIGYPFVAIVASSSEEGVMKSSPIGTRILPEGDRIKILSIIDDLSQVGLTTHAVTLLPGGDIRVELGMPWVLLFSIQRPPQASIANLGVVLAHLEKTPSKGKEVREIDLRFGNKIFYR